MKLKSLYIISRIIHYSLLFSALAVALAYGYLTTNESNITGMGLTLILIVLINIYAQLDLIKDHILKKDIEEIGRIEQPIMNNEMSEV